MRSRPLVIAQKLLNLYRQAHVIIGGWSAVNAVFVSESPDDVISELVKLPNGKKLAQHIENLKSGKTKKDGIERDLLPYGGVFASFVFEAKITDEEMAQLQEALNNFTPDSDGLAKIQDMPVVKKFGNQWLIGIQRELAPRPDLQERWGAVMQTARAYELWNIAAWILSEPLSERARARVQADLPEYETFLPMFGDAGTDLLNRLRTLVSSAK